MMLISRHGHPWTTEEDERLRSMVVANMSIHLIAAKLIRSTQRFKGSREHPKDIVQASTGRAEGEGEMTDERHLTRFLVRRGANRDWMVWDRHTKGPAKYLGKPAVELPEDQAREIAGELTKPLPPWQIKHRL
jgi:hypothetical protein